MSREQDREMLEKAAKAAGYEVKWNKLMECFQILGTKWNPIDSDADAFRLMVDCGIDVEYIHALVKASVWSSGADSRFLRATETSPTDKHAATRRAIVRSAAAMSEGKA